MKKTTNTLLCLLAGSGLSLGSSNLRAQSAPTATPETQATTTTTATPTTEQVATPVAGQTQAQNPIVMDPFITNASSNVGYGAGSTSSTARVVQSYVDVPQTVNVITSEFLEDLNSQDVRQALEYVSNINFGLTDNPYAVQLRGANVTSTYIDGVTIPGQYSAMPLDFFDKIEIVKGPSSITFGLGQPGGLINYVSKTPQGINSTSVSFGMGDDYNYLFRFDMQRVDKDDPKLSYRIVGFWDDGGYEYPNLYHSGAGAQVAANYALNSTTNLGLIVAYSKTTYPAEGLINAYWAQSTEYYLLQVLEVGNPVYTSIPGTKFANGSVFDGSGTLPVPGTTAAVGILGTGNLAATDTNSNPLGWDGDTNDDLRASLLLTKSLADGHIHLRNQLALEFDLDTIYDETVNGLYSVPGPNNIVPAGVPNGGLPSGLFALTGGTGEPLADLGPGTYFTNERTYTRTNSSSRYDEFDALATYNILGVDLQALAGANFYDTENRQLMYEVPDTNPDGSVQLVKMYAVNPPALYVSPSGWSLLTDEASHTWGDGFFAQVDALPFNGMFDLMAGWRIDYYDDETLNYAGSSVSYPGWVNTKGAPRFSITYKPTKWLSVYELYTKHADPTQSTNKYFISSGTEDNPPLSTEYPLSTLEYFQPGGYTVESGLKASLLDGRLYASLAVFHEIVTGDIEPLVIARATNPDGTNTQIAENTITGFNAHGIEAEVFGQLTPRFTFTGNWGFTRGYYPALLYSVQQETGVTNGSLPNWVDPPMTITGHFKYDFGNLHGTGLYLMFGTEFWSPYWFWETATSYIYYNAWQYQLDGGLGYKWKWGKYRQTLSFNINNMQNTQISIGSITPGTEEPLRSWFVTYKIQY